MNDTELWDAPTKNDLGTLPRPWKKRIEYAAGKTPEAFVEYADEDALEAKGKLGLYYYDYEKEVGVPLKGEVFLHLHTFSRLGGKSGGHRYWSNLVKDSRVEQFTVSSNDPNWKPLTGLYSEIKSHLPKDVSYSVVMLVYLPNMQESFLLEVSFLLDAGLCKAVAEKIQADASAVNLFTLQDKAFWGWKHVGYERVSQKADPYTEGDLYFAPAFAAGVMKESHQLRAVAEEKRREVLEWYESTI